MAERKVYPLELAEYRRKVIGKDTLYPRVRGNKAVDGAFMTLYFYHVEVRGWHQILPEGINHQTTNLIADLLELAEFRGHGAMKAVGDAISLYHNRKKKETNS